MVSPFVFLGALIFPTAIANAGFAYPTVSAGRFVGVRFGVLMPLWAVGAVGVFVALVLGFDTGSALAMPGAGNDVSVVLGVLMPLWAVGDIGFPASPVSDFVLRVLGWGSPVEIAQLIVVGVVVGMTALGLWRPWTYKGQQHESMNGYLITDSIPVQGDGSVSTTIHTPGLGLRQNAT